MPNAFQTVLEYVIHDAQYTILVAFQVSKILRGFVWEKVAGWQGLPSSNIFPYKCSYHFQYLNCCQVLYSNATDFKRGSSTYCFPALFISGTHKVPVLNLRVGRSLDQVLQRAYYLLKLITHAYTLTNVDSSEKLHHIENIRYWRLREAKERTFSVILQTWFLPSHKPKPNPWGTNPLGHQHPVVMP